MTGYDIIKRLREMEQKDRYDHVEYGEIYKYHIRNAGDLLLSIAEAFQPGDAERLNRIAYRFQESAWGGEAYREEIEMLTRLQAAAEQLCREGKL